MGSRGAFKDVNSGDFTFIEGKKEYHSIGTLKDDPNVKLIVQDTKRVKAPEYSHTAGRIYAIVSSKGELKHLAYYDADHKQAVSIDFLHDHHGVRPHRHEYLSHDKNSPGVPPTAKEWELIRKIKKEYKLI